MTSSLVVLMSLVVAVSPFLMEPSRVKYPHHGRSPYIIRDYKTHRCRRPCDGSAPRVCKYYFLVEHYTTLSRACRNCPANVTDCQRAQCVPATGRARGILTVNRMLPGPVIDVCHNDTIEVVVDNRMAMGEGLSIHWHGMKMVGTPHMDGTNLITQCPISSWGKMKYRFAAADPGTYFWHSHSSIQRADGLFGGLIIRQKSSIDPQRHLYDVDSSDHLMVLSDWVKKPIAQIFVDDFFDEVRALPYGVLVNGIGTEVNGTEMPTPVFTVEKGKRYRFRVVLNGILNCPVYISIDSHPLLVIASDGQDIEPIEVDRFMILSGERWDFVINANQTDATNFWIRFKARGRGMETLLIQTGILRYEGAPDADPDAEVTYRNTPENGRVLNGMNAPTSMDVINKTTNIQVVDLKAKTPTRDEDLVTAVPDVQYYMSIGSAEVIDPRFQQVENDTIVRPINMQLNYISSRFPPHPPLTEFEHIPKNMFCNNLTMADDCSKEMCECVHTLPYRLGEVVELVMVNYKQGTMHPMHMHGHSYTVVAQKFFGRNITVEEVKAADARGDIPRIVSPSAPRKDTLGVRQQSVVIIRFRADNPGFWFFHCHIEFHAEVGMSMLLQEGTVEDMPPTPVGTPRCGHWVEPDDVELTQEQEEESDSASDNFKSKLSVDSVRENLEAVRHSSSVYNSTPASIPVRSSDSPPDDDDDDDDDEYESSAPTMVLLVAACIVIASVFGYVIYRNHTENRGRQLYKPLQQLNSNYRTI